VCDQMHICARVRTYTLSLSVTLRGNPLTSFLTHTSQSHTHRPTHTLSLSLSHAPALSLSHTYKGLNTVLASNSKWKSFDIFLHTHPHSLSHTHKNTHTNTQTHPPHTHKHTQGLIPSLSVILNGNPLTSFFTVSSLNPLPRIRFTCEKRPTYVKRDPNM